MDIPKPRLGLTSGTVSSRRPKCGGKISGSFTNREVTLQVELIDRILDDENIKAAIHAVKSNKYPKGTGAQPESIR